MAGAITVARWVGLVGNIPEREELGEYIGREPVLPLDEDLLEGRDVRGGSAEGRPSEDRELPQDR